MNARLAMLVSPARLALLAVPLALAACSGQGDFRMPWDKAEPAPAATPAEPRTGIPEPTGASPTVQALQVEGATAKISTADAETLAVEHFIATGTGWTASVSGNAVRFERPGAKAAAVSVRRIPYSGGVEYIGVLGEQPFVLRVRAADCGGQPLTATLRARGTNYTGCATPSKPMAISVPKAAPAKPAAPKKAASKPKPAAAAPAVTPANPPASEAPAPTVTTPATTTPPAPATTTTPAAPAESAPAPAEASAPTPAAPATSAPAAPAPATTPATPAAPATPIIPTPDASDAKPDA